MKIAIPEGFTTAQYIANTSLEELANMAAKQGYGSPHGKAEQLKEHWTSIRTEELNSMLERDADLGRVALSIMPNGVVVSEKDLQQTSK